MWRGRRRSVEEARGERWLREQGAGKSETKKHVWNEYADGARDATQKHKTM
jgi:hypothetical protein